MGKLVGGAIVVVIALVLLPLWLPIVAVGWGVRRLRTPGPTGRPRRGRAVAAIAAGLVFAGGVWPALATSRSGPADPVAVASTGSPTTPPASTPTTETGPAASPTPSLASTAPVAATTDPVDAAGGAAAEDVDPAADPATSAQTEPADGTAPAVDSGLVPVVGVVDGDTIKVRIDGRTERVRVIGIDTPELAGDECFAQAAASRMQSLAQSRSVRLIVDPSQDERDRYGRLLRHVILADGRSAARVLIAEGFSREYTYDAAYRGQAEHGRAQESARTAGRGVWSSGCDTAEAPETATRREAAPEPSPDPADAPAPRPGRCDLKGNISSDGEKIYHVPGGRSYARSRIDEGKGERMFCSEEQARAAGWRAARD